MTRVTIAAAASPPEEGSSVCKVRMFAFEEDDGQSRVRDANMASAGIRDALSRDSRIESGKPPDGLTRLWDVYIYVDGIGRGGPGSYAVDYHKYRGCPSGCVADMMGVYKALRSEFGKNKGKRKGKR